MRKRLSVALAFAWAVQAFGADSRVVAVDVNGMIHPVTVEIVSGAIHRAERVNASLVLLRLNTPGGLMDAMRNVIERMISSPVPVVAYVHPSGGRAASAGFFMLQAADVAAMAPGTNTGAAHPVAIGGQMDSIMKQKVENDAAAYLRSITAKRGRNSALAETAIRESRSFTEREALDQKLIDLVAPSEPALLEALDGRTVTRFDGRQVTLETTGATVVEYEPTWRQRIISSIADPNIALALLVLGALLIYVEFSSPGLIAPGVIGAILALLGLSAISVLPINGLGAALLILALALFALEVKYTSHGILGAGGAVAMALGAVMLIESPVPEMRVRWATAIALTLPFSLITIFLVSLAMRARRAKVETGAGAMIGEIGKALTPLTPEGKVFVRGEYWDAVSTRPAPSGARVRVTALEHLKLTVEPLDADKGA